MHVPPHTPAPCPRPRGLCMHTLPRASTSQPAVVSQGSRKCHFRPALTLTLTQPLAAQAPSVPRLQRAAWLTNGPGGYARPGVLTHSAGLTQLGSGITLALFWRSKPLGSSSPHTLVAQTAPADLHQATTKCDRCQVLSLKGGVIPRSLNAPKTLCFFLHFSNRFLF